jgi:TRAP-type C4-dicarboxylate transport system substrate-binding protein
MKAMLRGTLVLLIIACWSMPAFAAQTMTYSNFFPAKHIQSKLAAEWCKAVEKATGGELKFQYLPGQTLTKPNQSYDAVVNGIADVAMSVFAYTRGRFPVMEVVDLPLGYPSGVVATKVINQVAEKLQPKELKDTQVMYLHAHGPGLLHTKNKPVTQLSDLKGMKIRATGTAAKIVKALGAAPVATSMPQAYQYLQKNMVEGAMYPLESNKGWKLGEVTKFVTMDTSVAYTTAFYVVMNKDKYNSLSEEAKAALKKVNAEFAVKHGEAWDASDQAGKEFFLSLKGRKMVSLTPEESARWKKAVKPALDDYVAKVSKKGLDGKAILQTVQDALKAAK